MPGTSELRWLALGVALANREHLARLLAEARPDDWRDRGQRRLAEAMAKGRDEVVKALGGLGATVVGDQRSADAVLDAVLADARRERTKEAARRVSLAAEAMADPAALVNYLAQTLADLREVPPVAGRITEAG